MRRLIMSIVVLLTVWCVTASSASAFGRRGGWGCCGGCGYGGCYSGYGCGSCYSGGGGGGGSSGCGYGGCNSCYSYGGCGWGGGYVWNSGCGAGCYPQVVWGY